MSTFFDMSPAAAPAVCYVIDSLAASGGAEQALVSMAPRFVAAGVRLDVCYLTDRPGLQRELRSAGAELHGLFGRRPIQVRELTQLLRRRRPDLVHTTLAGANGVGRLAGTLAGVPVVTSLVNVSYGPEYRNDPALRAWKIRVLHGYDAATAWRVRRFHALTPHVAQVMSRRLFIGPGRIDVIPRGRDRALLGERTEARRTTVRNSLGVSNDSLLVLAAARHEWQKGLDVLIASLPKVLRSEPNARLVLAGREGSRTESLRRMVADRDLGAHVQFLGSRSDVADLMCAADMLVVPSRWEGLGSVLIEAMALRTPLIATNVPAITDTVGEDCALVVAPQDSDGLADAVLQVRSDPAATERRVRAAAERFAERYELDQVCQEMLVFYERALAS
jgi:glycosyltransferase involved in cell wall biosynthesis